MAYARLATIYSDLGQSHLSDEYRKKAFQLRDRTSEHEKFYITAHYYLVEVRSIKEFKPGNFIGRLIRVTQSLSTILQWNTTSSGILTKVLRTHERRFG
jgi:hypothetical protein